MPNLRLKKYRNADTGASLWDGKRRGCTYGISKERDGFDWYIWTKNPESNGPKVEGSSSKFSTAKKILAKRVIAICGK